MFLAFWGLYCHCTTCFNGRCRRSPRAQFFKAHDLKAASYDVTALLGVLGATLWQFAKYDTLAAKLMVPYFAFSAFAAALTFDIRAKNGDKVE